MRRPVGAGPVGAEAVGAGPVGAGPVGAEAGAGVALRAAGTLGGRGASTLGSRRGLGDQLLRDQDHHAGASAGGRPEGDGQPVLAGQAADDREAQAGAGQRRQVQRLGRDGLLARGPAPRRS